MALRAQPGERVALIDQGRRFDPVDDPAFVPLAGDESALPAIAGILRDLRRDATGLAVVEIPGPADEQTLVAEGRHHLVAAGMPKARIVLTGYWKAGRPRVEVLWPCSPLLYSCVLTCDDAIEWA